MENTIRPSAIGKKNWLFVGDAQAGVRAATFYTLLDNAKRAGADAYEYLKDLFTKLPAMTNQQMKEITPRAWMARRADQQKSSPAPTGLGYSLTQLMTKPRHEMREEPHRAQRQIRKKDAT